MAFSGKVAVLFGGIGSEREVSINSGRSVADALISAGVNTITADITPQHLAILDDRSIDVFFVMLHGNWGEDGQLQKLLEQRGLIFTGSGSSACRLAFDKAESKELYRDNGLPTLDWITVDNSADWVQTAVMLEKIGCKFVVKPACEGSSTGVELVGSVQEAVSAAKKCTAYYGKTIIEKYAKAREFTVGILAQTALPIIEIRPEENFYDYKAKYISDKTEYLFDTIDDENTAMAMRNAAIKCFKVTGCEGFARVDFLLTPENEYYILEINTIPGFTSHSLLPKAAQRIGLGMSDLCLRILQTANTKRNTVCDNLR